MTPAPSLLPTAAAARRETLMNARAMFQRVLSGWATDVLALRRRGWDRPCLRLCSGAGCAAPQRRSGRAPGRKRAA